MNRLLILSSLLLSFGFSVNANDPIPVPTKALCMESGQTSPFILAEIYEDHGEVELKYMNLDGSIISSETLRGSDPDLSITNLTTDEGDKLTLIQSIISEEAGLKIKVLVCTK